MAVSGISGGQAQGEFLTLLVAQLQNQDPLDPVAQEDFIGQLAQFSTLSGVESLNSNFESMLTLQQNLIRLQEFSAVSDLTGRTVTYVAKDGLSTQTGIVDDIKMVNGQLALGIDGESVSLSRILTIQS
jgi:flagellar basal-body rod modification protein FlgD